MARVQMEGGGYLDYYCPSALEQAAVLHCAEKEKEKEPCDAKKREKTVPG